MVGQVHQIQERPPHTQRGQGSPDQQMAVTYADVAGADLQTIRETACLANTGTFAKLYRIDAIANANAELAGAF